MPDATFETATTAAERIRLAIADLGIEASGRNRTCVIPSTVGEEPAVMPGDRRQPGR
jgi:hypothetical protein